MDEIERKKGIRRTTFVVSAIAIAFFVGFILMGVMRA